MRISCIQMDMQLGQPNRNFAHARELIERAVSEERPDTVVLPETWNTGFFPKEDLAALSDRDGERVRKEIGGMAASCSVNIVAGSVANERGGKIYNTCFVFDRSGACVASYDKTHLFTPMGEDRFFTAGDHLCRFTLDGIPCGVIICYDVRFPELIRSMSLPGMDLMFMVSQWPNVRTAHLRTLTAARAIE
ncbi:MAG: carbon-nitrogen family hydrolase, partial [Clostridia bacterium]|nr:carbon-nitrogen family hydrolase [Clostridia bacterium]